MELTPEQQILQRLSSRAPTTEPVLDEPIDPLNLDQSTQAQPKPIEDNVDPIVDPIVEDDNVDPIDDVDPIVEDDVDPIDDPIEDDDDEMYVTLDDEDVSLSQIKKWKDGHLRQSDYTKKTQKIADERKDLEQQIEQLKTKQVDMDELVLQLEAITAQEDIDFDELYESDPKEYIKQVERLNQRKQLIDQAKQSRDSGPSQQYLQEQKQLLLKANPSWQFEDGVGNESYNADMKAIGDYFTKHQYTQQEQQNIVSAREWQAILAAAKFEQMSDKKKVTDKKVRKAPISSKPTKNAVAPTQSEYDKARAEHKRLGTTESAMALRRARANLNK